MSKQPNILIVHTDQQSCWSVCAYGGTLVATPNIDRLASEGALFTQFFTNSAVCTPSRGCFLTGRYPHAHGAYRNNIPLNRDEVTFAEVLKRAGYETGYVGKWHLDGTPRPGWVHPERAMGFDDAPYMFNRGHWKKITDSPMRDVEPVVHPYAEIGDEATYTTDWLTTKTIDFIERERDRPFCVMLSIPDPHDPFRPRAPYDTLFDPDAMPLPATLREEGVPGWVEQGRRSLDEDWLRQAKAWYCGEVKLIDDCVGRLLACLEERGLDQDTIVVFTSDHGEYMGEHGLMAKNMLYETAYRVPLVVRWPEGIPAGTVVDRMVSTVDFLPTLCGLVGVDDGGRAQGRDASQLAIGGSAVPWEDASWIHHASLNRAGVFTPEFELAFVREGGHILFDRRNDPDQVRNLFADPEYAETVEDLGRQVLAHHREVESPAVGWLEEVVG